ncbi:hypothetical protein D3C87_1407750 [compost metagenome]
MHGAHQVAQKLMNTTFPLRSFKATAFLSSSKKDIPSFVGSFSTIGVEGVSGVTTSDFVLSLTFPLPLEHANTDKVMAIIILKIVIVLKFILCFIYLIFLV